VTEGSSWIGANRDSAPLSAKLLKNSTLKTYKGFPHGMPTTEADTINADLLTFLRA
jgi:non-heme chloroperoxidase